MQALNLGRVVGMSAYELAVSNGYEGTLESWLESLRYDHSGEYKQFTETIEQAKQDILSGKEEINSGKEEIKLSMTQIRDLVEKSLTDIGNAKKAATEAVKSEETEAVSNINSTESAALSNIGDAETNALASLANALDSAIRSINEKGTRWEKQIEDTGTLAKSEYNQNAIAKQKAFDDNAQKKQSAFDQNAVKKQNAYDQNVSEKTAAFDAHVAETQTTMDQHIKEKQDAFDSNATEKQTAFDQNAEQKIQEYDTHTEQIQADIGQLKEDMANVKAVTDTIDERILEAVFGLMRNGKVYQTEVYLTETNPTSDGVKTLANANMVCEPSTDTVEGRDDYEGIGIFNWFNCNYITDGYGRKIPTAIEGWGNGYKNDGSVDVGVIAMTPYWSVIEKDGKQIWTLSDTPNDDYGLIPWETARKEDGTYASYVIHSKYISGLGIDGLLRSFFNSKPFRNNCYNNMIDNYQKKGKACWGAGKERDMYVILHVVIKYATKNEQKIFKGTTSYNLQFSASIQRDTKETYFPLTNSQASQIIVGSYVSVGYGSKNADNTVNNDRGVGTIHQYADDVKVLRIEDIDENNKAVYLDIEEGFTTTPVALSDTLNAQITLSTMHWWSGTTDKVIGKHDGSMGSNTDGKHPFRVMGIECSVGGYIVYSDSVMVFKEDYSKDVYIAPRGVKHIKDEATIKSTYKLIGNIPGNDGIDWWIGDIGVDMETCSWFAKAVGKSDSQGWGDRCYSGGKSTSGTREDLARGALWLGSAAGSVFVSCGNWLDWTSWSFLGCD